MAGHLAGEEFTDHADTRGMTEVAMHDEPEIEGVGMLGQDAQQVFVLVAEPARQLGDEPPRVVRRLDFVSQAAMAWLG